MTDKFQMTSELRKKCLSIKQEAKGINKILDCNFWESLEALSINEVRYIVKNGYSYDL